MPLFLCSTGRCMPRQSSCFRSLPSHLLARPGRVGCGVSRAYWSCVTTGEQRTIPPSSTAAATRRNIKASASQPITITRTQVAASRLADRMRASGTAAYSNSRSRDPVPPFLPSALSALLTAFVLLPAPASICILVDNLEKSCERFERLGVKFNKKPNEGRMKGQLQYSHSATKHYILLRCADCISFVVDVRPFCVRCAAGLAFILDPGHISTLTELASLSLQRALLPLLPSPGAAPLFFSLLFRSLR